ncbi:MAG: hypothetical protein ISS79_10820 [Phycisphaerae bacterium]|nr:hypothetical protein [Phycisphaerae bacterium]
MAELRIGMGEGTEGRGRTSGEAGYWGDGAKKKCEIVKNLGKRSALRDGKYRELKCVFGRKMGARGENGGHFLEFLGVILVCELKMGILGDGIGHLVFRNGGKKTA